MKKIKINEHKALVIDAKLISHIWFQEEKVEFHSVRHDRRSEMVSPLRPLGPCHNNSSLTYQFLITSGSYDPLGLFGFDLSISIPKLINHSMTGRGFSFLNKWP
jgi:hypothetical protein